MAGDGKTSGNGSTSPFGPSGGGAASGGNDFVKNPTGAFDTSGGVDVTREPRGTGAPGEGANFVAAALVQPKGSYRNPNSVPAGGPSPGVRGGSDPSAARAQQFSAAGGPSLPKKPYKFR